MILKQENNFTPPDDGDFPDIVWVKVQEAIHLLWEQNPKLHDIGAIFQSIMRYGFQELPKYDVHLINVKGEKGAIKAGNGRVEALAWGERQAKLDKSIEVPRGIGVDRDGIWYMPIVVGVDAKNELEAKAYAVDSNNLTILGGDFGVAEVRRMWGDGYVELLKSLADDGVFSVSVDPDSVDFLTRMDRFDPEALAKSDELEDLAQDFTNYRDLRVRTNRPEIYPEMIEKIRQFIEEYPEWQATII